MRRCALAVLLICCAAALPADGLTPAQQHLRACNTQAKAKGLSGAPRSRFITDCLNGRKAGRPLTPLQARNEACTEQADRRRLVGAERRGFMSECAKPDAVKRETAEPVRARNCNRRADGRRLDGEERRKFLSGCLDGAAVVDG
jgi:hypothetical protein